MKDTFLKLKKLLTKNVNIKNTYLLTVIVISLLLIAFCFSYAIFTYTIERQGVLNITVGNLYSLINSEGLTDNYQITVASGETKYVTINVENINSINAKYQLHYKIISGNATITGYELDSTNSIATGSTLGEYGSSNSTKSIVIGIENTGSTNATVEFGSAVGLSNVQLDLPNGVNAIPVQVVNELPKNRNANILAMYAYEETNAATKCITGEEATCQETTEYEPGTIVKYKVNAIETKYFYILHDDGDTLTMQQRENTLESAWYSTDTHAYGPTVAIAALETETADWDNVLDQTYTMGTTVFGNADNAFTGCAGYDSCTENTYTWPERTGKARMITLQEAADQGCRYEYQSCPIYMSNYLSESTYYGGTVDEGKVGSYWTMSTTPPNPQVSSYTQYSWYVSHARTFVDDNFVSDVAGVRAVVVIDK